MVSHCGAGYSRYEELAVTRWRADGTRDHTGQFCYVKDVDQRPRLVGGAPAGVRAGRLVPRAARHRPRHLPSRRRRHRDAHRDRGRAARTRPRCAASPSPTTADEPREIELTSYGEIVLAPPDADRAHPAFAQPVRRDRVARVVYRDHRHPASALGHREAALVRPRRGRRAGPGRPGHLRDRSGALPRPRPLHPRPDRAGGGRAALRHHRRRARPDLRAAHPGAAGSRAVGVGRVHHARRHHPGSGLRAGRPLPRSVTPRSARSISPGPPPRSSCASSTSPRPTRRSSRSSPGTCSTRSPALQVAADRSSGATGAPSHCSGPTGSRETGRSCWPRSTRPTDCRRCASSSTAHHYWRRRGMMVDLVVLNAHPTTYFQDLADRITSAVYAIADTTSIDKSGGVFVRRKDQLKPDELLMLRATARVHIPCDGRSLGKILATAVPDELPTDDLDDLPVIPRAPARSDSRVSRAVRRISAGIPALLAPLTAPISVFRPIADQGLRARPGSWRWTTASAASPTRVTTRSGSTETRCRRRRGPT